MSITDSLLVLVPFPHHTNRTGNANSFDCLFIYSPFSVSR